MNARKSINAIYAGLAMILGVFIAGELFGADMMSRSNSFKGPKANTGSVIHSKEENKMVLTLSDDFKAPDAPDPHWQVIDSQGNVYMLQKLSIKGDKMNRKIVLPAYIKDVSKVQMWCAFAETNLGEATFDRPVM
jgi:hypothetical protein